MRLGKFVRGIIAAGLWLALLSSGPAYAASTTGTGALAGRLNIAVPSLPDFSNMFADQPLNLDVKVSYDLTGYNPPSGEMPYSMCFSQADPDGMAKIQHLGYSIDYWVNGWHPGYYHFWPYYYQRVVWPHYITDAEAAKNPTVTYTDTVPLVFSYHYDYYNITSWVHFLLIGHWPDTISYSLVDWVEATCQHNGIYDKYSPTYVGEGDDYASADFSWKLGPPPPPPPAPHPPTNINNNDGDEGGTVDTGQANLGTPDSIIGGPSSPLSQAQQAGDPINMATGDNELVEHDFTIGSGPMALSMTRTYHSQSYHDGHVGYGWTWSYGWNLNQVSWNLITIRRPDGKQMIFVDDGSGNTYWREMERFDEKVVKTSFGWRYTSHDHTTVDFDVAGQVLAIRAEDGQSISMDYDTNGNPVSVTGPFGRKLKIASDGQGRITSITGPMGRTWSYAYDAYDDPVSVTYPDGTKRQYLYEDDNLFLTGIADAKGRRYATFAYTWWGGTVLSDHPLTGNRYSVTYNADESDTITEPDGAQRTYTVKTVNGVRSVASVTDPSCSCGTTKSFTLDDTTGLLTASHNLAGTTNQYSYDVYGRLLTETQAVGTPQERTLSYAYDDYGHLTSSIDAMGNVTSYTYDFFGRKISETDALGHVTRWSYNMDGTVASKTDPDGGVTHYGYDANGDLVTVTAPDGSVRYMVYDAAGRMVMSIDAIGAITQYAYDARDRLLSTTYADGSKVTNTYNEVGDLVSTTTPAGLVTTYTYDADHHPLTVTRPDSTVLRMSYDGKGNLVSREVLDKQGTVVSSESMTYDADNRLLSTIHADGSQVTDSYDEVGDLQTVTDEAGRTTTNAYDALGRITSTTNPNNETVTYAYDPMNRRTQVTAANGAATSFSYNAVGEVTQEASPDRAKTAYTYGPTGDVLSKTDGNGVVSNYQYDAVHRLTGISYPSEPSLDVGLAYDADGRLTRMTDASGITTYTYDDMGRTTGVAWTPKGADQAVHLAYAYDAAGRLASLTYPSGRIVSYHYGTDGRIQDLDATVDGRNQTLVSNIAYSPLGGVASRTLGNGIVETRSYDDRGRLTAIDAGSVLQRTLSWSPQSTITAIANGMKPAASQTFGYDAADRLTSATGLYGNLSYTYDANGNRLSKADAAGTAPYSYQPNTNRLLSAGSITYSRDVAGNRLSDGRFTYAYGADNRLASVSRIDEDHDHHDYGRPNVLASYVYNGVGERVKKLLGREDKQATWYVYDLLGNLIAELNHRGRVTAEYVYGPTGRLATIAVRGDDGKGREEQRHHKGDDSSESVYWHINDHLGTPQELTDRRGRVVWAADYTPFGHIVRPKRGDEDRGDHGKGHHWKVTNNFRFPGQYFDAETGLNYNYYRFYDPANGRYTQSDPIGLQGGVNQFGYVESNPTRAIDPLGLRVFLTYHRVASNDFLGFPVYLYNPKLAFANHLAILMIPDNQKAFAGQPGYKKGAPNSGIAAGKWYRVLSAGPSFTNPINGGFFGDLIATPNRSTDLPGSDALAGIINPPTGKSDSRFISKLNTLFGHYKNDLNYDINPQPGTSGYNSNSFAIGLLKAAGARYQLPNIDLPGADKPVPLGAF